MRGWPPQHIVVAVDFGETSGRACGIAAEIARITGARVTLVHAEQFEAPPYFTHEQLDTLEAELKTARSHAEAHVREFAAAHGLAADAVLISEVPAVDGILHAADDADLVIMGSHGRRGPSRWWMGSVSERVVRASPVPVLVVHAGDQPSTAAALLARALVLRHGHDPREAAERARQLIEPAGGRVTVDETSPEGCDPLGIEAATLVVVPVAHALRARTMHEVSDVLSRRCRVPVLFVPGAADASTSPSTTTENRAS